MLLVLSSLASRPFPGFALSGGESWVFAVGIFAILYVTIPSDWHVVSSVSTRDLVVIHILYCMVAVVQAIFLGEWRVLPSPFGLAFAHYIWLLVVEFRSMCRMMEGRHDSEASTARRT